MNQKLAYHPAWEDQMAASDREKIEARFKETRQEAGRAAPLWHVVNHRGEYLVTVLIHNRTDEPLDLSKVTVSATTADFHLEQQDFPTAEWFIQPKTSSPWTFIFKRNHIDEQLVNRLEISDMRIRLS